MNKNPNIGEIVKAYWKGYFEVVAIRRRWENIAGSNDYQKFATAIMDTYDTSKCGKELNSLIVLKKRYKADGTPVNHKKTQTCDSSFCKPAKEFIEQEIKDLESSVKRLKELNEKI